MSNSLTKTKRRIASIQSTAKTTRAMGLIAMVKLRRHMDAFEKQNVYAEETRDLISHLFAYDKQTKSHYARPNKEASKSLYLVETSNLGLCGSYNPNVYKFVDRVTKPGDVIAPIGSKGIHHYALSDRNPLDNDLAELIASGTLEDLHRLAKILKDRFDAGEFRRICIVYTHYVNSMRSVPMVFQLLPVQLPLHEWQDEGQYPPEFDTTPRELIHHLLPGYLAAMLYERHMESQLSEQATRRNAMDAANDNADELLEKLNIEYNKARQGAITQEITEVVGGAAVDQ